MRNLRTRLTKIISFSFIAFLALPHLEACSAKQKADSSAKGLFGRKPEETEPGSYSVFTMSTKKESVETNPGIERMQERLERDPNDRYALERMEQIKEEIENRDAILTRSFATLKEAKQHAKGSRNDEDVKTWVEFSRSSEPQKKGMRGGGGIRMYGISANRELLVCPESELNRCIHDVNAESGDSATSRL
ncbi:MAG: hypothetical protein ING65_10100 [Rhodocyclaceae bacterium]|nr:hypothetical protein [Rhodocyclaceae bacterium]